MWYDVQILTEPIMEWIVMWLMVCGAYYYFNIIAIYIQKLFRRNIENISQGECHDSYVYHFQNIFEYSYASKVTYVSNISWAHCIYFSSHIFRPLFHLSCMRVCRLSWPETPLIVATFLFFSLSADIEINSCKNTDFIDIQNPNGLQNDRYWRWLGDSGT